MFTKGKWEVVEDDAGFHIQSEQAIVSGFHEDADIEIADINQYLDNEDEPTANAQLIASAPDLYEALKLTRNNLQTLSDAALHYKKTFSANLKILNQVLSKAEGK